MKITRTNLFVAVALMAGGCAMSATGPSPDERDEAQIARLMEGRVAGEPLSCVNSRDLRSNRTVGDGDILFEGAGGVVYVNRPPNGCPDLGPGRTLVTRTTSTQLCRGDIARVVDPVSGAQYGGCGLGDFVPYRRTDRR